MSAKDGKLADCLIRPLAKNLDSEKSPSLGLGQIRLQMALENDSERLTTSIHVSIMSENRL